MKVMKTFGVFCVVLVAVGVAAWVFQRRLIYLPGPDPGAPPPGWEEVEVATEDGFALRAWLGAPDRVIEGSVAVIVFPGNAGTRRDRVLLGNRLTAAGFSVLLVDYRGYGGNPGTPDENGLYRDARAARAFIDGAGLGGDGVVYYGESLGSGVAVALAAESPPDALVLRSPFTSLTDAAAHHFPWLPVRWFLRDRYPSLDRARSITIPTLVIAGTADRTVPYDQSRRLAAELDAEFHAVEGADHNDPALVTDPGLMDAILRFLATHTG